MKRHLPSALFFFTVPSLVNWTVLSAPSERILSGQQCGASLCWEIWWWAHAFKANLPFFRTDLLMFPAGVPLVLVSPVVDAAGFLLQFVTTPFAAANLLMIYSHSFTGFCGYLLFYQLTDNRPGSVLGGFLYGFSTFMLTQHFHGVADLAFLGFNALFVMGYLRCRTANETGPVCLMLAAYAGLALTSPYILFSFGFFFPVSVLIHDALFVKQEAAVWRSYKGLALTMAVGGSLAFLAYWPIIRNAGNWIGGRFVYSTYVTSLFIPPVTSPFRPDISGAYPEETMLYLGLVSTAALAFVAFKRYWKVPAVRLWLCVLAVAFIFSLGPALCFSPENKTSVPLPYAVFQHLPIFKMFRNPGRIAMTMTLASAAITALVFVRLTNRLRVSTQWIISGVLIAISFLEFGVANSGERWASVIPSKAYMHVKNDPAEAAVLELPTMYSPDGDMHVRNQFYLLFQIFHQKPMVLGFAPRHLRSSLEFTEKTPGVYELVHPWVLPKLMEDPSMKKRAEKLAADTSGIFKQSRVKYVLYHTRIEMFPAPVHAALGAWLNACFGPPLFTDENGIALYQAYGSSYSAPLIFRPGHTRDDVGQRAS